jgi:RNA ligase (TIGR02306 family)
MENTEVSEVKNKRKLVSIREVKEIFTIEGADVIEGVRIDGWVCVCKKGEFSNVGDLGVYFEIDAFLPASDRRYQFLSKDFSEFEGEQGARLKTRKFKGQVAQGLFLPLRFFPELANAQLGDDVTEILGVKKWEPAMSPQLAGVALGHFPSFITKTDQERAQNLVRELEDNQGNLFEATIKLDGSSMTAYRRDEHLGICSRNLELKETEENTFWKVARQQKVLEALEHFGKNYAIQGELIGEGVQDNREGIYGHDFFIFDIFDIDNYRYLPPQERLDFIKQVNEAGFNLKLVPFFNPDKPFVELKGTVDELLELASGPSMNPDVTREGIVWKREDGNFSFKTISNEYLLEVEKKMEKANKKSRNAVK